MIMTNRSNPFFGSNSWFCKNFLACDCGIEMNGMSQLCFEFLQEIIKRYKAFTPQSSFTTAFLPQSLNTRCDMVRWCWCRSRMTLLSGAGAVRLNVVILMVFTSHIHIHNLNKTRCKGIYLLCYIHNVYSSRTRWLIAG